MKYQRYISEEPAIAVNDWKRAALWFDDWRPVLLQPQIGVAAEPKLDDLFDPCFERCLAGVDPKGIMTWSLFSIYLENLRANLRQNPEHSKSEVAREVWRALGSQLPAFGQSTAVVEDLEARYGISVLPDLAERGVLNPSYLASVTDIKDGTFDIIGLAEVGANNNSVDVCLSGLSLVDAEKMSWEQIVAIRSDKEAVNQLRKLRRFVVSDMNGQPISYIQEELEAAVLAHRQAAKTWGLAECPAELSVECNSSLVLGVLTAVGALASGATPLPAAALGLLAPLGHVLFKVNRGRRQIVENSRVSYLVRVQNEAAQSSALE